jgi:plasmid stability protein
VKQKCAIIDSIGVDMAQLVVRRLDPEVVMELRKRAARSGRSMEAEHREILRAALRPGRGAKSLKEMLLLRRAAGQDSVCARPRGKPRRVRL